MVRLLDLGLEQLTTMVYKMGEVARKVVGISIRGLMTGRDASEDVRELSDILVTMTVEIEEKAFELIAKFQPVASDLRIINSYMKIAYDFERYGRYAWDISYTFKRLGGLEECAPPSELMDDLARLVSDMVNISVNSLRDNEATFAKNLADIEKEVDTKFSEYMDQLAQEKMDTKCAMRNLLVARFLERIADHTTYVGESIVYIVTGEKVILR